MLIVVTIIGSPALLESPMYFFLGSLVFPGCMCFFHHHTKDDFWLPLWEKHHLLQRLHDAVLCWTLLCWGGDECSNSHVLWLLPCTTLPSWMAALLCFDGHISLDCSLDRGLAELCHSASLYFSTPLLWMQCHWSFHKQPLPINETCLHWHSSFCLFGNCQQWVYLHYNILLFTCLLQYHLVFSEEAQFWRVEEDSVHLWITHCCCGFILCSLHICVHTTSIHLPLWENGGTLLLHDASFASFFDIYF